MSSENQGYRLRRTSTTPAHPLEITFNVERRTRHFNAANADEDPGSPQDVPLSSARAAMFDESLAPHFQCEPKPTAETPADGPAASAAAPAGEAASVATSATEEGTETSASRAAKASRPGR